MEKRSAGNFRKKSNVPRPCGSRPVSCELVKFTSERHEKQHKTSDEFFNIHSFDKVKDFYIENHSEELGRQHLGRRVCISGVKEGILRYYGRTQFSDGVWCGVELEEPVGKNDGTVNGVRYFFCRPNHGIFAPVTKISLVPSLEPAETCVTDCNFSRHHFSKGLYFGDSKRTALDTIKNGVSLKSSSSDPSFIRQKITKSCNEDTSYVLGDKRSLTEKRQLCDLADNGNNIDIYEKTFRAAHYSRPFYVSDISSKLRPLVNHSKYPGVDEASLNGNFVHLSHDETSNLFCPRKVMSEYAISGQPNKSAIKQSLSCPHTSHFASSSSSSSLLDLQSSVLSTTPTNQEILPDFDSATNCVEQKSEENFELTKQGYSSSTEFLDFQEDGDDEQMSLDFDESLGILTPSQMKDFTICADLPTSCTDIRAVDFPSSESFDDINDLPEDEQVHDVSVQYITSSSSTVIQSVALSRSEANVGSSKSTLQDQKGINEKHMISSTDEFLFSFSSNVAEDSYDSHCSSCEQVTEIQNLNSCIEQRLHVSDKEQCSAISHIHSNFELNNFQAVAPLGSTDFKLNKRSSLIQAESLPNQLSSSSRNVLRDLKYDRYTSEKELIDSQMHYNTKTKTQSQNIETSHFDDQIKPKRCYDTDSSRDSLLQAEHEHSSTKEKLTVSWEDCIAEEILSKVERPESVYTVGSSDTGYQEDGEFEGDTGMTTSMESTEDGKRFSTTSRDSCIIVEDLDKVAESTSTSGYSTGLSDSICNERSDGESSKRLAEDSLRDMNESCNSDDILILHRSSEELASLPERQDECYDTNSIKESESLSEVPNITESNTVLCLDSTSETLCDTLTDDIISVDQEENKAVITFHNGTRELENVEFPSKETELKNISVKNSISRNKYNYQRSLSSSQKSGSSSLNSTPEKKSNDGSRTKLFKSDSSKNRKNEMNKNGISKKSKDTSDFSDRKKQITKSPKRNVMSKIKAMIEATSCKASNKNKVEATDQNNKKNQLVPKKSRWEAVTSKIAASLAEEKIKSKAKRDIKSKVDTNLTGARQQVTCKSPKLDLSKFPENRSDSCMSPSALSSKSRKFSFDKKHVSPTSPGDSLALESEIHRGVRSPRSPRPGKTCFSSRSTSPVAASESSTSVSLTSHQSRSKIAVWKGSTSTVASSVAPVQLKKSAFNVTAVKSTTVTPSESIAPKIFSKREPVGRLKPLPPANGNIATRSQSPSRADTTLTRTLNQRTKTAKEQNNVRTLHPIPPKPIRPPMWLSKAELTQEIQHLGTLCEARTKELNRLKMETKHVTAGFDAFAVLLKYLTEDLNAFSSPQLIADLKEANDKLIKGKKDLEYYEEEIEELKIMHAKELSDLGEKLSQIHENELHEINNKHAAELRYLKEQHEKQLENITCKFNTLSKEAEARHEKIVDDLKQELRKQREEMEIFHQHELDDIEERYLESQKTLQSQLEHLQKQYAEMKSHSDTMEDALQKDTDSKLQWISSKKAELEKEVDSLKAVLEIKNNELHSLRKENLEMQKDLEELPLAREKIKMLQARAEDLQALMAEKVRIERQLSTEHQAMKETYERESKVNKRLSMENEELQWRLRQVENASLNASLLSACETSSTESLPIATPQPEVQSPVKSPRPMSASRPVFFTYMNQDEINAQSPQSPRTPYKRIQPSPYKTASSSKASKSPSSPSPRKSKSNVESSPVYGGGTPRKVAKHINNSSRETTPFRQRIGSEGSTVQITENDCTDMYRLGVADNISSSASSENSVFEQGVLEIHGDQILASLDALKQQQIMDISSHSMEENKMWCTSADFVINQSENVSTDVPSLGENIDPKTYYHMTFPVLKENGQDCETDDNGKELFTENNGECGALFTEKSDVLLNTNDQ